MKLSIKNAYTLVELLIVIIIIGILMGAMGSYLGGSNERTKLISAEGCMNTLDGELTNYTFFALTSKSIKNGDTFDNPTAYSIFLSGGNQKRQSDGTQHAKHNCNLSISDSSGYYCDEIVLAYNTGDTAAGLTTKTTTYKIISPKETCRQNNGIKLRFYWSGTSSNYSNKKGLKMVSMNKGFNPLSINDQKPFHVLTRTDGEGSGEQLLYGEIIIKACIDGDACKGLKDVGKRAIDARSQTISLKKCKFYSDEDPTKCEERAD